MLMVMMVCDECKYIRILDFVVFVDKVFIR